MNALDKNYDHLVQTIYGAAAGRTTWDQVCLEVADALDLWFVQIFGERAGTDFSWNGGALPEHALHDYLTTYRAQSPRVPAAMSLQVNAWMHDHQEFDNKVFETHPFFTEYLIPLGGCHCSATKLTETDALTALIAAHAKGTTSTVSDAQLQAIERLRTHLARALEMQHDLQQGSVDLQISRAMLEAIEQPVLLIDGDRRIHFVNQAASMLINDCESLSVLDNKLQCKSSADHDGVGHALMQIGVHPTDADGQAKKRPLNSTSVSVGRLGSEPEIVSVAIPVVCGRADAEFANTSRAIFLLHHVGKGAVINPLILRSVYELTPAEAIVAARVAHGLSNSQIATERGVGVETVRSQVRAVFQKVGVERRTELVSALMRLPSAVPEQLSSMGRFFLR